MFLQRVISVVTIRGLPSNGFFFEAIKHIGNIADIAIRHLIGFIIAKILDHIHCTGAVPVSAASLELSYIACSNYFIV